MQTSLQLSPAKDWIHILKLCISLMYQVAMSISKLTYGLSSQRDLRYVKMQNGLSQESKKQLDRTELPSSSKYTDLPQGHESLLGERRLQSSWTSRTFHRQYSFLCSSTEKGGKEKFLWQQLPLVASDTLLTRVPLILLEGDIWKAMS